MGWLSKLFKGNKHKGQRYKYDNAEDESSNNESSSEPEDRSVDRDVGETDRAACHFSPNDGWSQNSDVTDHDHHHNYFNHNNIEAHYLGYDYEGQHKIAPYSVDIENQSLVSQQQYHIDSPHDNRSTFQLDLRFFPSYSLFPVCQSHMDYGIPNSSSVWNRAPRHHGHESYFPNTTYEESQDLTSENSTWQTLRCHICKNPLETGVDGRLKYEKHPFWPQKYCRHHNSDGTPICSGCERLMAIDSKPLCLRDGRKICSDCQGIFIIMTTQDFQPLIREIQQLYEKLEMKVDLFFPIRLVDETEMNKSSKVRKIMQAHAQ